MNNQLFEINQIIRACENMVLFIEQNGPIYSQSDYHYSIYKSMINPFDSKYQLQNSNSVTIRGLHTVLSDLYWDRPGYIVDIGEAQTILQTVIRLKHELFSQCFEKIFISHSEKDKEQTAAFIELLYAIGIQRPLASGERMVFCSSHPDEYIANGLCNSEEIRKQLLNNEHTLCILWYSDNYFASQPCLNECGAIWVLGKPYQEILHPRLERTRIQGFLDKRNVSFRSNDIARLNDFKADIEKMFDLSPISQNSWEEARKQYIIKINNLTKNNAGV